MAARAVERLLNVIMTIGSRRRIDRAKLFAVIPDYAAAPSETAAERMFERDKAAILDLGLPLSTERDVLDENTVYYRIDAAPSEAVLDLDREEYTVLLAASRAWDDAAAGGAARRVRSKLLSLGHDADPDLLRRTPRGAVESLPVLSPLLEAVTTAASVRFTYRGSAGSVAQRRIEPWVVGVHDGHWYVYGWDLEREAPRIFRASRIESFPSVGGPAREPRPTGVDLAHVLGQLQESEDRSAALLRATPFKALELRDRIGAPLAEETVRAPEMAWPALRRLVLGSARWVEVLEPAPWRAETADVLERIAAAHEGEVDTTGLEEAPPRPAPRIRVVSSGTDRLSRLISEASYVMAREEVDLAELADALGISIKELVADLQVLFLCGDLGNGWEDLIEAEWEQGTVRVRNAAPLQRALRLTDVEITALLAGLAALEPAAGTEARLVERARAKLLAAGEGSRDAEGAREHGEDRTADEAASGAGSPVADPAARRAEAVLRAVHRALAVTDPEGPDAELTIRYSAPDRPGTAVRRIRPLALETDGARSYLRAFCHLAGAERQFRLDRVVEVLPSGTEQHPAPEQPSAVGEGEGADLRGLVDGPVWLRLEPAAHWIAESFEAEQLRDAGDGATFAHLTAPIRSRLVDAVLEAAGAATVVHPTALRDTIVTVTRTAAARHRAPEALR